MALLEDKDLKEALHATIAKQILEGLDHTHRDALLQKTLTNVIKEYGFGKAIQDVAAEKAAKVANELMESDEWTARIEQSIRDGFEDYLVQLRAAVPQTMKGTLHGKSGQYQYCGAILQCWPTGT